MSAEWSVRVRAEQHEAIATAGKLCWRLGPALSYSDSDSAPTSLQAFLAVLAAELGTTFHAIAEKRRIVVDEVEVLAKASLDNPLVALGVIGEEGSPACSRIRLTLFVSAQAETDDLAEVWQATLARTPVLNTLAPTQILELDWRAI